MKIPFLAWLLQGIPESIGLASVAISLGYGRLYWRPILIIGLIHAVIVYVVRLLPITFGVHTIILIITLAILSSWIGRINIGKAIIFSNIAILILALSEFCFVSMWCYFGKYSLNELEKNVPVRIVAGTPQVITLFLTAFFISKRNLLKKQCKSKKNLRKKKGNLVL